MNENAFDAEWVRKKYEFRWEILDVLIGGKSSIDSARGFRVSSLEDAERFIRTYGYNLENPIEKAEIFGHFHESINFIRKNFLAPENPEGVKFEIPRRILELADLRELMLMAALSAPGQSDDTQGKMLSYWACSILKVMHTLAHIDQDIRTPYFPEIQKQLLDRFYRVIHRDAAGALYLGESEQDLLRVRLVAFETKPKKARESILLKLLHKSENVAEDIFDRIGLRFVTHTRLDCLRVIKYLKESRIIMPANVKPSRSRNTLLDTEVFRREMKEVLREVDHGNIRSEEEILQRLEKATLETQTEQINKHSSEHYRAIQFTCRQLIKLTNPLYQDLKELKGWVKAQANSDSHPEVSTVVKLIDRMDLKHLQKEVRFFYPFEVQVVDQASFEENERGRSAHSEYKRAQLQTALKRVMGPLADAIR